MAEKIFEQKTILNTSLQQVIDFHAQPRAFGKLTPFPIFMQMHRDERTALTEGELEFTLWFGFIPIRWIAQHEPGPIQESDTGYSFADRQLQGPMGSWYHQHIFEVADGGVQLTDRITLSHKPGFKGLLTRLFFDGLPLRILFMYRHWRTRRAVER